MSVTAPSISSSDAPLSPGAARRRAQGRRRWLVQAAVLAVLIVVSVALVRTTQENLADRNIRAGFGFLGQAAEFAIGETPIAYEPSDSYARAVLVGVLNTAGLAVVAIVLSTVLGFLIGFARLSGNWVIARTAGGYIELVRNLPLLLQLFAWYSFLLNALPHVKRAVFLPGGLVLSNRGLNFPAFAQPSAFWVLAAALVSAGLLGRLLARRWRPADPRLAGLVRDGWILAPSLVLIVGLVVPFARPVMDAPQMGPFNYEGGLELSVEFLTLVIGLSVYTAAYIAEIVRGAIQSSAAGQREAAIALGLRPAQAMRHVILPQAMRSIIPPMVSWHINTVKNTSLAVAIGYADIVSIVDSIINQTGQAIEGVLLIMGTFLLFSVSISRLLNWYNDRLGWSFSAPAGGGRGSGAASMDLSSIHAFTRWARRALFGTRRQSILSLAAAAAWLWMLWRLLDWAILQAVIDGDAQACRAAGGACWLFIRENYRLILFGTYPEPLLWRPALVCGLFAAALALSFVRRLWGPPIALVWLFALVAAPVLMSGKALGLTPAPMGEWSGLPVTLILASSAVICAFPLAVALALGRQSQLPIVRALSAGFIDVMRGVPLIGVLFMAAVMFPLFVPEWLSVDSLVRVAIALILFTAAYMAEAIRGGLLTLPDGQRQAAMALGLTGWQSLRRVILPQTLRVSMPGIVNTAISEVKNTTLVLIVGVFDVLQTTRLAYMDVAWRPFYVEAYVMTGAIFFVICLSLSRLSLRLEQHLAHTRKN